MHKCYDVTNTRTRFLARASKTPLKPLLILHKAQLSHFHGLCCHFCFTEVDFIKTKSFLIKTCNEDLTHQSVPLPTAHTTDQGIFCHLGFPVPGVIFVNFNSIG